MISIGWKPGLDPLGDAALPPPRPPPRREGAPGRRLVYVPAAMSNADSSSGLRSTAVRAANWGKI